MAMSARRGPAPIASFDHDGSDESSPETKNFRLPEIHEDSSSTSASTGAEAARGQEAARGEAGRGQEAARGEAARGRSASTPGLAPGAPRIDISRASSSSHQDSRDSSPELALAGGGLGFREDGALDLRSSTEELAFLEAGAPPARRPSRKDSQGSEAALLAVSGRTSRLSSVGSQCSAHSAFSFAGRASRLSVASGVSAVSGVSRSPSPHKMLLETSFCGPKPIETEPEICAAAEERLLELVAPPRPAEREPREEAPRPRKQCDPKEVQRSQEKRESREVQRSGEEREPREARDCRRVRTEATVERAAAPAPTASPAPAPAPAPAEAPPAAALPPDEDKRLKETRNRARADERQARSRERRDPSDSRSKDIIRIRLKPDTEYDDDDVEVGEEAGPARAARPTELAAEPPPPRPPRGSRTPSPSGAVVSRKSSFCSLFKSRETIASPDSPSDAHRRRRSPNDGRSRSRSRDRSATPTSAAKIRGSVLSLFRAPRRSATSPGSRAGSPAPAAAPRPPPPERLKYYEEARDGIIHIPLRTPPGEPRAAAAAAPPVSAAGPTAVSGSPPVVAERTTPQPIQRTVLPDGSIIIPLHSPTERTRAEVAPSPEPAAERTPESGRPGEDASSGAGDEARLGSSGSEPSPAAAAPAPADGARSPPAASGDAEVADRPRRRERLVFTTNVGSRDQVFSTQLSITKTPSVTSEISGSFASFPELPAAAAAPSAAGSPGAAEGARDSSGSEASSEAAPARCGSDVEQRGLVVQESFEELPYVPTTLPQERSLALPMVPVRERERGGVRVAARGRPRPPPVVSAAPPPPVASPPLPAPPGVPPAERIRIQLPRRPRAASAAAPPARPERSRARSGSEGLEARPKGSWIDFSEVPERRKQPKRIQTLPAATRELVSYAAPEDCRCECHARPHETTSEECGEHARTDDDSS